MIKEISKLEIGTKLFAPLKLALTLLILPNSCKVNVSNPENAKNHFTKVWEVKTDSDVFAVFSEKENLIYIWQTNLKTFFCSLQKQMCDLLVEGEEVVKSFVISSTEAVLLAGRNVIFLNNLLSGTSPRSTLVAWAKDTDVHGYAIAILDINGLAFVRYTDGRTFPLEPRRVVRQGEVMERFSGCISISGSKVLYWSETYRNFKVAVFGRGAVSSRWIGFEKFEQELRFEKYEYKGLPGYKAQITRPFVRYLSEIKLFADGVEFPKQYVFFVEDGIWIPADRWREGRWRGVFLATDTFPWDDKGVSNCDVLGNRAVFTTLEGEIYLLALDTEKVERVGEGKRAELWRNCTVILDSQGTLNFNCPDRKAKMSGVSAFALSEKFVAVKRSDKIEFYRIEF